MRVPVLCLVLLAACQSPAEPNPAAPGFDHAGSDARAIAIADQVMQAMGGRAAWDAARVIRWDFFGRHQHAWDKLTGDIRVLDGAREVRMNLHSRRGRAFENGVEVDDAATLSAALDTAHKQWINDSYWLVMPYKLKDDGVTLRYKGEESLPDGRTADVLVLTFRDVGVTPENRYEVWVSQDRHLVERWAFFATREDTAPKIVTAWGDWKPYGGILLSSYRNDERQIEGIEVLASPPAELAP